MDSQHFQPTRFQTLLALVRRDYAVQFAGMGLGLSWLFINYAMQIAVFWMVLGKGLYASDPSYVPRLISGMALWLPLSEMWMRSGSILSENRVLIRRTHVGRSLFSWIPVMQAFLHYGLLALPLSLLLHLNGQTSAVDVLGHSLSGLLSGWVLLLLLAPWAFLLSRWAVILRDLTPLLRPFLQILFWLTPIAYKPADWSAFNPLTLPFALQTAAFTGSPLHYSVASLATTFCFLLLTMVVLVISSLRLNRIVEDHL